MKIELHPALSDANLEILHDISIACNDMASDIGVYADNNDSALMHMVSERFDDIYTKLSMCMEELGIIIDAVRELPDLNDAENVK